jgi:hypothetical protein
MKKIILLTFVIIGLTIINSCKKNKEQEPIPTTVPNKDVTAEKTNVKTYEIINIIAHENLANKYNATFGTATIELLKTSDSTLTFYVPDIAEGEANLKFELATIKFSITKTPEVNPNQLVTDLLLRYDSRISAFSPLTPEEEAEIDSMEIFSGEIKKVFNSLTEEQKRQTALFYEANKEVFKSFSDNVFSRLDAPNSFKQSYNQSDCPKTNYKSFYDCTSANLSTSYSEFKETSKAFVGMISMATVAGGVGLKLSAFGPLAWGATAFGVALPMGVAVYLGAAEVWPVWVKLKNNTYDYLKAPWIFSEELFNNINTEFSNESYADLNLDAGFRTLNSGDGDATPNTGKFIKSLSSLNNYWEKVSSLFGKLPPFQTIKNNVTLTKDEITISNISNPNVQYQGNIGQSVRFKSLSGNEEIFNYKITVSKEGFVEEKTMAGKILAAESIEISSITVFPNKLFSNETSGFIHSNSIDLEINVLGTPKEFAIVPNSRTPLENDWISTIPIQNKITYNYQASFNDMTSPGVWDLIVYIKSGGKITNKPFKVRYTTIVPHISVIDNAGTTTSAVSGIPSSLVITDVFIHTYIAYYEELLGQCSATNSFSSLTMMYKNGTGNGIAPFPSKTYGRVRFYDIDGTLIEELSPAPFAFYKRRCVSKGDNMYHLKIAYAEICYSN